MTRPPPAYLLALALLVGLSTLAGPGSASIAGPAFGGTHHPAEPAGASLQVTLTPPIENGTVTATPTSASTPIGGSAVTTAASTPTASLVDDPVNETESTTRNATGDLDSALSGAVSLDGSLELTDGVAVESDVDVTLAAGAAATSTPAPGTPTPSTAAGAGETPGTGIAPAESGQPDGGRQSPRWPVSPLTGGALVGGAVVTSLAGRALVTGSDGASTLGATVTRALAVATDVGSSWRERLWPALGLYGYQRFDDSDPLTHAGRERLYELVRAEPGVHLSAVSDSADLPLSTARYHLRILEHEGLVRGVKLRGKRRFFPPDVGAEALVAALADDATATVLRSLVREGPGSVSELADRLDRDPSTVSHHLDRLADDGLVEREREGPAVVSTATPAVEAAVKEFDAGESEVVRARPAATSD